MPLHGKNLIYCECVWLIVLHTISAITTSYVTLNYTAVEPSVVPVATNLCKVLCHLVTVVTLNAFVS